MKHSVFQRKTARVWGALVFCVIAVVGRAGAVEAEEGAKKLPNILFAISDDQSQMHVGAYGDRATETPAFDRLAREGVLFNYAFTACPSCSPSRSAILTGQDIYRLEEGGVLIGHLSTKFPVFTRLLEKKGYEIASTGKTWGPGSLEAGGWTRPPTGKAYRAIKLPNRPRGISSVDYAANFNQFLKERDRDRPFFFWYGASEPHQSYEVGAWKKAGKKLEDARLPGCLPDAPETRGEILDYGIEIEHFDRHLARMIAALEKEGLLENTLVIATSDHGNPLPRAKCNLYDAGTRVPFVVRWPARFPGGRVLDDFVSLKDLAPTFLDITELAIPDDMTGKSLTGILESDRSGVVDPRRNFTVTAFERHTICRRDGLGYPMRAIRTHRWSYIRNYNSERWPAGGPTFNASPQGFYGDVDAGAAKSYMMGNKDDPKVQKLFDLAFGRRPPEELYDMDRDPDQLENLAGKAEYRAIQQSLNQQLVDYLIATEDPRLEGKSHWDSYPYYSKRIFENPNWRREGKGVEAGGGR